MDELDKLLEEQYTWKAFQQSQWDDPDGEDRLIRYRRSSNGIWQEVWLLENGSYFYGLYMPEGFVPPPGMGE
jgi:hypothetical protein